MVGGRKNCWCAAGSRPPSSFGPFYLLHLLLLLHFPPPPLRLGFFRSLSLSLSLSVLFPSVSRLWNAFQGSPPVHPSTASADSPCVVAAVAQLGPALFPPGRIVLFRPPDWVVFVSDSSRSAYFVFIPAAKPHRRFGQFVASPVPCSGPRCSLLPQQNFAYTRSGFGALPIRNSSNRNNNRIQCRLDVHPSGPGVITGTSSWIRVVSLFRSPPFRALLPKSGSRETKESRSPCWRREAGAKIAFKWLQQTPATANRDAAHRNRTTRRRGPSVRKCRTSFATSLTHATMLLSDYDLPWNPSRIYEEIGVRPRTKGKRQTKIDREPRSDWCPAPTTM